ncbi:MAG: hypothetical protein ACOYXR_07715 [Nitrospirota bacterium]
MGRFETGMPCRVGMRRWNLVAVAAILGVGGVYLHPMFGPGLLITGDHPFYFALVSQVAERLHAAGGAVGWFESDFGGFPAFSPLVPAPLSVLVLVALNQATSISLAVLYKLMVFFSFVFPAIALWVTLSERVDRLAACGAVGLYLALTYQLLQPLQGMWIHYLALGPLLLLVHYCDRWLTRSLTLLQAATLGALTVITALTDALTWPLLAIVIPVTVVFYTRKRGITGRALVVGVGAFLVSGVAIGWWIAAVVVGQTGWGSPNPASSGGLLGLVVRLPAWFMFPGGFEQIVEDVLPAVRSGQVSDGVRLAAQLAAEHLAEGLLVLLAVGGLVGIARDRGERDAERGVFLRYTAWILAVFVLFVIGPWHFVGGGDSVIAAFRQDRFVLYVNAALIVAAAYGLQGILRRFGSARYAAVAVVVLAVLHGVRYATYTNYVALKTSDESVIYEEMAGVWAFVKEHVAASNSRVMYEELEGIGFLDGGYANVAALSTQMTGVGSIVTQRLKTQFSFRQPAVFPNDNPFGSIDQVDELMKGLNCSYLVVWHPMITQKLLNGGQFTRVYESRRRLFSVLQVNDADLQWLALEQGTRVPAKLVSFDNERLVFEIHNNVPRNRLRLKISYHPWWSARVNGQATMLTERDRMMELDELPEGDLVVEFFFRPRGGLSLAKT